MRGVPVFVAVMAFRAGSADPRHPAFRNPRLAPSETNATRALSGPSYRVPVRTGEGDFHDRVLDDHQQMQPHLQALLSGRAARRMRPGAHDRRGAHAYRPDCGRRVQDHDLLGWGASHAPRHLRPGGLRRKQGPAPGFRHERHAHHARGGRPPQAGRGMCHGHQPRQPRRRPSRRVPWDGGRLAGHGRRHARLPGGGPSLPDSYDGARLERGRGVRHHRFRRGAGRRRALRVLPHPRGPRQVHQRHGAQGGRQRASAAPHHGKAGRGAHRRQAYLRPAVHPCGEAARRGDALCARLPGGPHLLHREPRGGRAPVRLHDAGSRQRARAALRRDLEDEPGVRAPAHSQL